GYKPVLAEAHWLLGVLRFAAGNAQESEAELHAAALAAEASGDAQVAARAWTQLVWGVGYVLARPTEGRLWGRYARAAIERAGGDPNREAMLALNLGTVALREERYASAGTYFERARVIWKRTLGPDSFWVSNSLMHLGTTHALAGDF